MTLYYCEVTLGVVIISDVAFPIFSSQDFTERVTPAFLEGGLLLFCADKLVEYMMMIIGVRARGAAPP